MVYMKSIIKKLLCGSAVLVLILIANYGIQSFAASKQLSTLLKNQQKVCPDIYFVDSMPSTIPDFSERISMLSWNYVVGVKEFELAKKYQQYLDSLHEGFFSEGGYFVLKGDMNEGRTELSEIDLEWVYANCKNIKPNHVY